MQIDFAHNGPVLVRISRELFRPIRRYYAQMVIEIARCARYGRAKETFAMNSLRFDRLLRLLIEHDFYLARIGAESANLQIVADTMRSQDAERIGMRSCEKSVQFVGRQAGNLERFHYC